MVGFELRISGVGSNHSTNWATTATALNQILNRTKLLGTKFVIFKLQRDKGRKCLAPDGRKKDFPQKMNFHFLNNFPDEVIHCQCDQMAKIFFNIGPFITIEIWPKAHNNSPKIL